MKPLTMAGVMPAAYFLSPAVLLFTAYCPLPAACWRLPTAAYWRRPTAYFTPYSLIFKK